MGIDKPILEEHAVLHADGGQFTSSYSEKSIARRSADVAENPGISVTLHIEQPDLVGVKKFLPALRSFRVAQQRPVVPFLDAVTSSVLFFSPTNGEIFQLAQGVIDDCAITQGGPTTWYPRRSSAGISRSRPSRSTTERWLLSSGLMTGWDQAVRGAGSTLLPFRSHLISIPASE